MLFISALHAATINVSQDVYTSDEDIVVTFDNMLGDSEDWVGIYPSGASNDWDNVVNWSWTGGVKSGTVVLDALPQGNYEARAFYQNSFHTEAAVSFSVQNGNAVTTIKTSKDLYTPDETVRVIVKHMLGDGEDWVGIYPAGSSNDWNNVVSWAWTDGIRNGTITLDNLPEGDYEARAFFNNSFNSEASYFFKVQSDQPVAEPIVYEDAENGINNWIVAEGNQHPSRIASGYHSSGCIKFPTKWKKVNGVWHNEAEYYLAIDPTTNKFLDVDVGGVGTKMPHYVIGVRVITEQGERKMYWDSWYNHQGAGPMRYDYGSGNVHLVYPSPIELVRGYGYTDVYLWEHFRVDLEAELHKLEPENNINTVIEIFTTGGFLDNITLSPN
jgi:hypothetical protein